MAVNPEKNAVDQGFITRLIGNIKRIALDMGDSVAAETSRAQAAEAVAKTEVVQGENCSVTKTTAADGHDVYTVNADGKPQVQIFEAPYSNGATVWPSGRDVKAAFFAGKTPVIRYQEGPVANYDEYLFMSYTTGSGYYEMKFSYKDKLLTYNSTSNVWGVTNAYSSSITSGDTNAPQGGAVNYALAGKVDTTGDASNTTSTFTKASDDTSTMASGVKLSAIFTAISSFFATVASHLSNTSNPHNVTPAQIGAEHSANKVASWSSTVNDTHYPSEKLVKDSLDAISSNTTPLIAGTNISITTSASGVRIDASDPAAITDAEINALFQ